jgi:hypothetical protein
MFKSISLLKGFSGNSLGDGPPKRIQSKSKTQLAIEVNGFAAKGHNIININI